MLPLPGGGKSPTHSPNRKHRGSPFRVGHGINSHEKKKEKKKKSNPPIPNKWVEWGRTKKLTDIENYPESPNENAIWISTLQGLR